MASRYVHVESIQQAREFLELGLLYENMSAPNDPYYRLCDSGTPRQLDDLEAGRDTDWPLSDYVYVLED